MAFNSDTYHANKCSRDAYAEIAKAKDIKRRAATGEAYDWEINRIPHLVRIARSSMRLSVLYRQSAEMKKKNKKS